MIANWVIGVLLATIASIVSNLGLNLQKLNHTLNEQKIRQQLRRNRRAAAAAEAALASASGREGAAHASYAKAAAAAAAAAAASIHYGVTGTKIIHDSRTAEEDAAAISSYQTDEAVLLHGNAPASNGGGAAVPSLTSSQQRHLAAYEQLNQIDYTRQTMWRGGFGLVTLGSVLDFVALIFASQSLIAPLGSLTLVSNTILAPLILGESISRRDLVATGAIVVGACLAILGADHSAAILPLQDLFDCFLTIRFALYALVTTLALLALFYTKLSLTTMRLREPRRYAQEHWEPLHRFSYAALAGIMGAQSVLFAKCTGQILVNSFEDQQPRGTPHAHMYLWSAWQTYMIILGMFSTIYFQISWLNSGLKHFEALYVVPVFQSFWILVSVVAGMIFFGEYRAIFRSTMSTILFPLGVIMTIAGVYVLSQRGGTGAGAGGKGSVKSTPQPRDFKHYKPSSSSSSSQQQQQPVQDDGYFSSDASESSASDSPSPSPVLASSVLATPAPFARSSSNNSSKDVPSASSVITITAPTASSSSRSTAAGSYRSLDDHAEEEDDEDYAAAVAAADADAEAAADEEAGLSPLLVGGGLRIGGGGGGARRASYSRQLHGHNAASPAPPIGFMSGPFIDPPAYSLALATAHSWKEESRIIQQQEEAKAAAAAAAATAIITKQQATATNTIAAPVAVRATSDDNESGGRSFSFRSSGGSSNGSSNERGSSSGAASSLLAPPDDPLDEIDPADLEASSSPLLSLSHKPPATNQQSQKKNTKR